MKTLNEKLYDNLLENADNMTDEWLSYRIIKLGSVYSSAAGDDAVQMLRKQNRLTIRSIATRLSGQTGQFETMKRKWAELVAESRIRSNTPIHEVFDAVMRFRTVYWSYIERFIRANNHEVQRTDVLRWGSEMNQAFDELFHEFSRTYHEMTEERMIAQQKMIRELGTPVIKIDGERGILPLIGDICPDSQDDRTGALCKIGYHPSVHRPVGRLDHRYNGCAANVRIHTNPQLARYPVHCHRNPSRNRTDVDPSWARFQLNCHLRLSPAGAGKHTYLKRESEGNRWPVIPRMFPIH